jgi:hypothetical protein
MRAGVNRTELHVSGPEGALEPDGGLATLASCLPRRATWYSLAMGPRRAVVLGLTLMVAGCEPGQVDGPRPDGSPSDALHDVRPVDSVAPTEQGPPDGGPTDGVVQPDGAAPACWTVGAWSASAPFVGSGYVSHPLPSFASGSYFFVHTMKSDGSDRKLYSASQQAGGGLSAWQVASPDHGGGPHGFTAIDVDGTPFHFRNGHIAKYVIDASGIMQGDVVLLEDSTSTSFGGNKYVWDTAVHVALSGVLHLGGFSFTGYTYVHDVYYSAVPIGSAFTKTSVTHPASQPGKAVAFAAQGKAHAFIYTGEAGGSKLWRAKVQAGGQIDPFAQLGDLPPGTGNGRGDWFLKANTLFVIRGSKVFRAALDDSGDLSSWLAAPALPGDQIDVTWGGGHVEGASCGVIGGHVYVTGDKQVYHAALQPASVCGP